MKYSPNCSRRSESRRVDYAANATTATTKLIFNAATKGDDRSLSGAVAHGRYLFVAPDEGASIVRLRHHDGSGTYRAATAFSVSDVVPVPGSVGDEIDLEGMDVADGFLWLVGSHSAVRARADKSARAGEVSRLLAEVTHPPARRLLARVPLDIGPDGPEPVASMNEANGATVFAASLPDNGIGMLSELLSEDEHLGPFIGLPGKDNGLDIEGLAVIGSRVLLGLRGPVLRGWAVIVEIEPRSLDADPTKLELTSIGNPAGRRYAKYFIDLQGLGIRDLARDGNDLLILAGPTMILDGPSRVLRLRRGVREPLPDVVTHSHLKKMTADLPISTKRDKSIKAGCDHPEAITVIGDGAQRQLLMLYDSPSKRRRKAKGVLADLTSLD